MKVPIYDSELGWLGTIPIKIIKIDDASSGLQRVTVRVPNFKVFDIIRPKPSVPAHHRTAPARPATQIELQTSAPAQRPPAVPPRSAKADRNIEITLIIPRVPKLRDIPRTFARLLWSNRRVTGIVAVSLVAIVAYYAVMHRSIPVTANNGKSTGPPPLVQGTPDYATVLPAGKTIADYGGWTRISPPNRGPVYAYVDKIGNVQIDVSEQPLPAGFATNTAAQIAQLAQNFNATEKFTVAGTQVYISTSGTGDQSVILNKADLLILIKSTSPLTNNQWAAYVAALH